MLSAIQILSLRRRSQNTLSNFERKWSKCVHANGKFMLFRLLVQVDKLDILPGLPNKHRFEALEDFAGFREIMYDIFH